MSLFALPMKSWVWCGMAFSAALLAAGAAVAVDSRPIAAWGDSLTLGFGSAPGEDYPASAARLMSRPVANHGIGGQTSTQIAARMGALPVLATVESGMIPASGDVGVAVLSVDVVFDAQFVPHTVDGTLCGVHGALRSHQLRRTFLRASASTPVRCQDRSTFRPDIDPATHNGVAWLWLGRNGADAGRAVEQDVAAAVASLGHDRYLVGSVLTAGTDGDADRAAIAAMNASLKAAYGPRYVDLLGDLLASSDGSPGDTADVASGIVPRSLRIDFVHLTPRGNAIVARAFVGATERLGF